jgi:protease I
MLMNKKKMRKTSFIILILSLVIITGCHKKAGYINELPAISGKKVLIVIASQNFRDEEYKNIREVMEKQEAIVTVASSSSKVSKGMLGMKVQPDKLLGNVKAEEYDAVIFIGGLGAREYWDNQNAYKLVWDALSSNKILGAISIAPVILARAKALEGKKVTILPSEKSQLKNMGAIYTGKNIERYGNIITAAEPSASREFAVAIVKALSDNP